ncbi:MAG: hypothetical protein ABSF64_11500 [Bryobacteraceae bacterium]
MIRQAAQGGVLHNDDTGMRILRLAREPGDKRTGTFTSGGWKQMCDALPRNTPKLEGVKTLLANCIAHEDGSLWKWPIIFLKNAVMCWRRRAVFIAMMGWRTEFRTGQSHLLPAESLAEADSLSRSNRTRQSTITLSSVP